ncbi:MAG: S41 family peptidase [Bacteroidota bacterium]
MNKILRISLILFVSLLLSATLKAQDKNLSEEFKAQTIERLSEMMNERYVFPDVAEKTSTHIQKQLKDGHFKQFKDVSSFAEALTESVQFINKDKHMRIRPNPPYQAPENTPERMIEERLDRLNRGRSMTAGFFKAEKMEGNVGYLDLRGFASVDRGAPVADNYMKLLSTSDAVIIDLRRNGGGDPEMVQYLCSFFFDERVHLNSLYWRQGEVTTDFWTLDKINGERMPEVPLFVLTSDRTFSAAEEFSYNMQTQKRATLVGQTTGGGANPGQMVRLNKELGVFIPTGRAINPITKTNWEGVGVIPEVKVSPEETLDKAHELAKEAAQDFRSKRNAEFKLALQKLFKSLNSYAGKSSDAEIEKSIKHSQKLGLLAENEINGLGYEYLMREKKPKVAEIIFKTNTKLYPKSANVYDSYGEALAMNGKLEASVKSYQKAVELAVKNEDGNLELFRENLAKVEKQLSGRQE